MLNPEQHPERLVVVIGNAAAPDGTVIAALAEKIFERLPAADDDTEDARLGCSDIFAGLAVHQNDARSLKMLDVMIGAPTTYGRELRHIIFRLSGFLHDKKTEVRKAAFALLGRILDVYIAAKDALDARFAAAPDQWQTPDRELYGDVLKGIDEVATRIQLTVGRVTESTSADTIAWGTLILRAATLQVVVFLRAEQCDYARGCWRAKRWKLPVFRRDAAVVGAKDSLRFIARQSQRIRLLPT